jgi:hypothetical protein
MEPATVATALYVPNTLVRRSGGTTAGSMACSSEVKGPDSTTSVDIVPASATKRRIHSRSVSPKTRPETERPRKKRA